MCLVQVLPDKDVKDMCIQFADIERRLGEIDRARGIYGHAAQFCDPRIEAAFWQVGMVVAVLVFGLCVSCLPR